MLLALGACHSEEIQNGSASSDPTTTKIVYREVSDATVPICTVHLASPAFSPAIASQAGVIRVEGDYTRTLAKVWVDRSDGYSWNGSFNGPKDPFFDMLRRHVCTKDRVYALRPMGNKDLGAGPVVLGVYEVTTPDEKADVVNICNALSQHAHADAGADDRDRAAMQWVEDVLTSPQWDGWRDSLAHARAVLYEHRNNAQELFRNRGIELEFSAKKYGVPCPTADEWKTR